MFVISLHILKFCDLKFEDFFLTYTDDLILLKFVDAKLLITHREKIEFAFKDYKHLSWNIPFHVKTLCEPLRFFV